MMDPRPGCYILSLEEIVPLVPEMIFEGITIYGRGDHLGHVTQIPRTNFSTPHPWRLNTKFGFGWRSGFGEGVLKLWTTTGDDDERRLSTGKL